MTHRSTRRELLRPLHLLGIAFGCALFGGFVTGFSMGGFQNHPGAQLWQAWSSALVVAGIVFIAVLLGLSILLLVIDPSDVTTTVDRPVLLQDELSADEQVADQDSGSATGSRSDPPDPS